MRAERGCRWVESLLSPDNRSPRFRLTVDVPRTSKVQ